MGDHNWKRRAMKILHRDNNDLIANFRDNRKKSITDIKIDLANGKTDDAVLTKEIVEQLLKDNEDKMFKVDEKFESSKKHLTNEEMVNAVKKKLKNQYIEKLKETFNRLNHSQKYNYTPKLDGSFIMGKYKEKSSKQNLLNNSVSYLDKLQQMSSNQQDFSPTYHENIQQFQSQNDFTLNETSRENIHTTERTEAQDYVTGKGTRETYIDLDYQEMHNSLRKLMFDDLIELEKYDGAQENKYKIKLATYQPIKEDGEYSQQTTENSENFIDHVDKLIQKMEVNDSTIFKTALQPEQSHEQDKYATSSLIQNSFIKGNLNHIKQSIGQRDVHETYEYQVVQSAIKRKVKQKSRSVLPAIITPKTVQNSDSLIQKMNKEISSMKNSERKLFNILRSRKDLLEDWKNTQGIDVNVALLPQYNPKPQVKLPKIIKGIVKIEPDQSPSQLREHQEHEQYVENLVDQLMTQNGTQVDDNNFGQSDSRLSGIQENVLSENIEGGINSSQPNITVYNPNAEKTPIKTNQLTLTLNLSDIATIKSNMPSSKPSQLRMSSKVNIAKHETSIQVFSRSESMNNQIPFQNHPFRNQNNYRTIELNNQISLYPGAQSQSKGQSNTLATNTLNSIKQKDLMKRQTRQRSIDARQNGIFRFDENNSLYRAMESNKNLLRPAGKQITTKDLMNNSVNYQVIQNEMSQSFNNMNTTQTEVSRVLIEPIEKFSPQNRIYQPPRKEQILPQYKSRQYQQTQNIINQKIRKPSIFKAKGVFDDLIKITTQSPGSKQLREQYRVDVSTEDVAAGPSRSTKHSYTQPQASPSKKILMKFSPGKLEYKNLDISQVVESSGMISELKGFTPHYNQSPRDSEFKQ